MSIIYVTRQEDINGGCYEGGGISFCKTHVDNNTIIYRLYRLGQPYIYSIWETQAEKEGKVTRITVTVLLRFL